jgi:hypothetical protein
MSFYDCDPEDNPFTRATNVLIARNFIHHNRMQDYGYGVESNWGGFPLVDGNVFVANRHAIAAGAGSPHTGYRAWHNLVLSDAPLQDGAGPFNFFTHDFDMHGTENDHGTVCQSCNGFGGRGGDYVEIFANTFLGTNRASYELRAQPCHNSDFIANVSLQDRGDAVIFKDSFLQTGGRIEYQNVSATPPQFNRPNPTNRLAVGDFDGDGIQDTFLATGAAWYFAPQGRAEWRLLNDNPDTLETLLLGDFDGDGRTDVLGNTGTSFDVSWGGRSAWEHFNSVPAGARPADFAVGHFVADAGASQRSDIFYANGTTWFVAAAGSGAFTAVNASSFRVPDLRFGDGDGVTDVFGVTGGTWSYSRSATGLWQDGYLRQSLADIDRLVVADFDGNGRADVAEAGAVIDFDPYLGVTGWNWRFSLGGVSGWTGHRIAPTSTCGLSEVTPSLVARAGLVMAVGQFNDEPGSDLLLWGSSANNLCIAAQGVGALARHSTQNMR